MKLTIEKLRVRDFLPTEHFVDIVGLHIDPLGNVAGYASKANNGASLGFYWKSGETHATGLIYQGSPCIPKAMDDKGRVFLHSTGLPRHIIFDPHNNNTYIPLPFTESQLYDLRGAGGDGWGVGWRIDNLRVKAVRIHTSTVGQIESLLPAPNDGSSAALCVNMNGVAAGSSNYLLSGGFVGEEMADRPGRAVIWVPGEPVERIPEPHHHRWIPQIGRAINNSNVVVGSTSPMPPSHSHNPCYIPERSTDLHCTHAFVSFEDLGKRWTMALPNLPNDNSMTTITAFGINDRNKIVGTRAGVDCPGVPGPSLTLGILWEESRWGHWDTPSLLGDLLRTPETLGPARAINQSNQFVGDGNNTTDGPFAYRLTPI